MKQVSQEELSLILEHFATMEACTPCIDIMRRIEAIMLESGDNKLAEQATKALESVFRVYQQAAANVPDSFWEDRA